MKKTVIVVALFAMFIAGAVNAQGTAGWMSRYWDGCKTHCSWRGNSSNAVGGVGAAKTCNQQNQEVTPNDQQMSACGGGPQYYCWDHAPVQVSENMAYGFVARNHGTYSGKCGECYELTFTGTGQHGHANTISGKKMTVMLSNTGGDVGANQFDLLVPGGGVGQFNAFSGQLGVANNVLGAQYGGFLEVSGSFCKHGDVTCLRNKCNEVFNKPGQEHLREGCVVYADFLGAANNPNLTWTTVTCPQALSDWYKPNGRRPTAWTGGGGGVTTYTITFNINYSGGTNPQAQTTGGDGRLANLPAPTRSGYTFDGWFTVAAQTGGTRITSGGSGTVFSSNTTVYARWTQSSAATYTVTFNANGGSVSPATAATGTDGRLASLPTPTRSGYNFNGWFTAQTGGQTVAVNQVYTANTTIWAQWTQTPANTFTITFNANGGSVNPATAATGTNGRLTSLPTPTRSGYNFNGWFTAQTGGQTVAVDHVYTANTTIWARWTQQGGGGGGANRTDTTKIEAETLTQQLPNCNLNQDNPMCIATENGITNIGYITNGSTANYNLTNMRAGAYTMVFRIAAGDGGQINFTVSVNGSQVGTINQGNTGGWNNYVFATLNNDVQLNQGNNSVELRFSGAVNVDYFLLLGEASSSSVRPGGCGIPVSAVSRTQITIRPAPRGFSAALPANHTYTSYKLIDLRGREIRSGQIESGMTELRFNSLNKSVMFLRLDGRGVSTVLRAAAY